MCCNEACAKQLAASLGVVTGTLLEGLPLCSFAGLSFAQEQCRQHASISADAFVVGNVWEVPNPVYTVTLTS